MSNLLRCFKKSIRLVISFADASIDFTALGGNHNTNSSIVYHQVYYFFSQKSLYRICLSFSKAAPVHIGFLYCLIFNLGRFLFFSKLFKRSKSTLEKRFSKVVLYYFISTFLLNDHGK